MKLVYVTSSRIPTERAYGQAIMKMCEAFAETGVEVTLISPKKSPHQPKDSFEFHAIRRTFVHTHAWGTDLLNGVLVGRWGYWTDLLTFLLSMYTIQLPTLLRADVVFTRELAFVPLRLFGIAVVLESHALPARRGWYLWCARFLSGIVTISQPLKRAFESGGVSSKKICVLPSGVDLATFQINTEQNEARATLELPQGPLFLYTGNFTTMGEDKGILDVFRALAHMPQGTFVAVGAYPEDFEHYTSEARKHNVQDRVIIRGRESQANLALYQRAADILLMPFPDKPHYRNAMSPIKMFEYMASGRPIIASDLPTIREVLNDSNAYFVQPGDAVRLSSVLQEVFSHSDEAQKRAEQARRDVQSYSWLERARALHTFFAHL
ncbi:glycosyltransferase [bacterium]|nr:glycosyltransferase [bacterium]